MDGDPAFVVAFRDADASRRWRIKLMKALENIDGLEIDVNSVDECETLTGWEVKRSTKSPSFQDVDLFVEDTTPATYDSIVVPNYNQKIGTLNEKTNTNNEDTHKRSAPRRAECFNCDEDHMIKDCPYPRNYQKINQRRNEMKASKASRYYDDESQENGVMPGHISKELRLALGLKKHQLPMHIYKMRKLGYPPGWLLNAKISHSGIALFDSSGNAVESNEDPSMQSISRDEYDVKKILDFPGFNVPHSSKYIDEYDLLGYPPFNEEDSKVLMLEKLAPRAANIYRRKKLKIERLHQKDNVAGQADMDIENEECENEMNGNFCSGMPPLPKLICFPPVFLPHMVSLPLPPGYSPPLPPPPPLELPPLPPPPIDSSSIPLPPESRPNDDEGTVKTPRDDEFTSECDMLSLTDLESQRLSLMAALQEKEDTLDDSTNDNSQMSESITSFDLDISSCDVKNISSDNIVSAPLTPIQGKVKDSTLGSPMFCLSEYNSLPKGNSFSKDICDVMTFENLPDSIGKYGQISGVIKKIRESIASIQQQDE